MDCWDPQTLYTESLFTLVSLLIEEQNRFEAICPNPQEHAPKYSIGKLWNEAYDILVIRGSSPLDFSK